MDNELLDRKQVKCWLLSYAVDLNKKGTSSDKILKDAKKFYKFVYPDKCKVVKIKEKNKK